MMKETRTKVKLDVSPKYPNGEKIKFCLDCGGQIPFMGLALMSTTVKEKWVCIDCFAKQIQSQAKGKKPTLEKIKKDILSAGVKKK